MRDPRVVYAEKIKHVQELYKQIRALQLVIPLLVEPEDSGSNIGNNQPSQNGH